MGVVDGVGVDDLLEVLDGALGSHLEPASDPDRVHEFVNKDIRSL